MNILGVISFRNDGVLKLVTSSSCYRKAQSLPSESVIPEKKLDHLPNRYCRNRLIPHCVSWVGGNPLFGTPGEHLFSVTRTGPPATTPTYAPSKFHDEPYDVVPGTFFR